MDGMAVFAAVGPCLMMASAAVALLVVNLGFSRTSHAGLWAIANALGAAQWGLVAAHGSAEADVMADVASKLLSISFLALLAVGLHRRRDGAEAGRRAAIVMLVAAIVPVVVTALQPSVPLRAAIFSIIACALLTRAAWLVVPAGRAPARTELMVAAVLLISALVHGVGGLLATGELLGLVGSHVLYALLYLVAAEPAVAAGALAFLMLIAFDYADELRRLLHTDPLTGVLNRPGFDHAMRQALARRPRRLALAVADIDHFKQVNDVHGHATGDATLVAFAGHLAQSVGRDGAVARIGGEEFAVLLPMSDGSTACERIERVRAGLVAVTVAPEPSLRVSASFGIAEWRMRESAEALIERADAALYASKRAGRDRTTLAEGGGA